MTPVEILKAARDLIAKPERWTRGYLARTDKGLIVHSALHPRAVCWCAIGAVDKCAGGPEFAGEADALLAATIRDDAGIADIASFNDSHDHAEVLALFDRAIASAQS